MSSNERTGEGVVPTGQPPDAKAGVRKLIDTDPQVYEIMVNELRHKFGLPEKEYKTLDDIVAWVLKKCEQANSAAPGDDTVYRSSLKTLFEVLFESSEGVPLNLIQRTQVAAAKITNMHAELKKLRSNGVNFSQPVTKDQADGNRTAAFVQQLLEQSDMDAPAAWEILRVCLELAIFLISKNSAYGNSALDPVRIMSSADPAEQLRVRMDDKLSRLIRGRPGGEDAVKDLVGYWVLMQVADRQGG